MFHVLASLLFMGLFFGVSSGILAILISPLQFIKVNRQATGYSYRKIFLSTVKTKKIGTFFRGAVPYSLMNFLSSMAFGFSEYLSNWILLTITVNIVVAVILRAALGGFIETLFSVNAELKEISFNKGNLMVVEARVSSIFTAILIRNIIFWFGTIIPYELSQYLNLTPGITILLSLVFGVIFSILSITFDVVATKNCGSTQIMGVLPRFKTLIYSKDQEMLLAGILIRIVQLGLFTANTVATMLIYESYIAGIYI